MKGTPLTLESLRSRIFFWFFCIGMGYLSYLGFRYIAMAPSEPVGLAAGIGYAFIGVVSLIFAAVSVAGFFYSWSRKFDEDDEEPRERRKKK